MRKQSRDGITWVGTGIVWKYGPEWSLEQISRHQAVPFEVLKTGPNKIMFGGASAMWECLMGRWSDSFWNHGSAALGVGDSGAFDGDQTKTDLVGTQKRRPMDTVLDPPHPPLVYPIHTDGFTSDALSILFQSTFAPTEANFHWREWAAFNSISGGRMLNRKVEDLGLKLLGQTWVFLVQLLLEC